MTEKEAMESPLHEVWRKLDAVDSALRNPLLKYSTIEGGIQVFEEMKSMLRRVLLERCDNHKFNHEEPEMAVNPAVWVEWHREMSAFHSFWAWELQQREKDGSKVQA